ncbi:MAG: hypothetical protein ACLFWM_11700 [Actinomycetota bacterium]
MDTHARPIRRVVAVDERFAGPPGMANGGYISGLVTAGTSSQVVLHRPVPLSRTLIVSRTADGNILTDGEGRLLTAVERPPVETDLDFVEAHEVAAAPPVDYLDRHPFPRCFVCGTDRAQGDGMVIHPRRVGETMAAVFTPPDEGEATVPVEYLTAALDCPAGWAVYGPGEIGVLGTFEVEVTDKALAREPLVVVARGIHREGRRRYAESAVFSSGGGIIGAARSIWIDFDPRAARPSR